VKLGSHRHLWSETIALRLSGAYPEAYSDISQDAVADWLRSLEVEVKPVRETGGGTKSGCTRRSVEAAAASGRG
jgi:hypothetical protein